MVAPSTLHVIVAVKGLLKVPPPGEIAGVATVRV
jgi:hypothetical protein